MNDINGVRRNLLIVACQCDDMPHLSSLHAVAHDLDSVLRDSEFGGYVGGLPDGRSIIGDAASGASTKWDVERSVNSAIECASERQAHLLLAFLGHGFGSGAVGVNLMCADSREGVPTSALRIDHILSSAANTANIDGVLALVDVCSAGGAMPAAVELSNGLRRGQTRLAVLMSSSIQEPSYGMSFTREVTALLTDGVDSAGPYLYPATIHQLLTTKLQVQTPTLSTYLAGRAIQPESIGLPLGRNRRQFNTWAGTLESEWVRELTRLYCHTTTSLQVQNALNQSRLVLLEGPSASGKSTTMAAMTRDDLRGGRVLDALVFCESRQNPAALAERIGSQLAVTLPGNYRDLFVDERARAGQERSSGDDAWEIELVKPLSKLNGAQATIGLDAVDQLEATAQRLVWANLNRVLDHTDSGIRFVASCRAHPDDARSSWLRKGDDNHPTFVVRPQLLDATTVARWLNELGESRQVQDKFDDRPWRGDDAWLLARLMLDLSRGGDVPADPPGDLATAYALLHDRASANPVEAEQVRTVEAILAAVGAAPIPLAVFCAAIGVSGVQLSTPQVRDLLGRMSGTVVRIHAGTDDESVQPLHSSFVEHLRDRLPVELVRRAHGWVLDGARSDFASSGAQSAQSPVAHYHLVRAPLHLLGAGRFDGLVDAVENLHRDRTRVAADRCDDWQRWLALALAADPDIDRNHPATALELRFRVAKWMGGAGKLESAHASFADLLDRAKAVLPADDEFILSVRHQLARYRGRLGHGEESAEMFTALLRDRRRVQGPHHRYTLKTELDLARWHGYAGNPARAAEIVRSLLPVIRNALEDRDQLFMRALEFEARVAGDMGDPAVARAAMKKLYAEAESREGLSPTRRLDVGHGYAWWTGRDGDPAAAAAMLEQLAKDSEQVLGPDDKDTLIRIRDWAHWCGEAGDVTKAVALLRDVVPRLQKCTGYFAHDVLDARHALAWWMHFDDPAGAAEMLRALKVDLEKHPLRDRPRILNVRIDLARFDGDAGHPQRAVDQLTRVIAAMEGLAGVRDDDRVNARHAQAWWIGESGDPGEAARLLGELAQERRATRGENDRNYLLATRDHARWLAAAGRRRRAALVLDSVRAVFERVFGDGAELEVFLQLRAELPPGRTNGYGSNHG